MKTTGAPLCTFLGIECSRVVSVTLFGYAKRFYAFMVLVSNLNGGGIMTTKGDHIASPFWFMLYDIPRKGTTPRRDFDK